MQNRKKHVRKSRRLALFKEWKELKEAKSERGSALIQTTRQKLKNSSKSVSVAIASLVRLLHFLKTTEAEALAIKAIDEAEGKETEGPEFFEDIKQQAEDAADICQELQRIRKQLEHWQASAFSYNLKNTQQTEQQPKKRKATRCKECGQFAAIGKPCTRCNYINTAEAKN